MPVRYVESSRLPTAWAVFTMHGFEDVDSNKEHLVLTLGDVSTDEPVLTRIHSECLTGDALFSLRCDCGNQLQAALRAIASEGRGALFYLRQEGRGIGLLNKVKAYHLQDEGAEVLDAGTCRETGLLLPPAIAGGEGFDGGGDPLGDVER